MSSISAAMQPVVEAVATLVLTALAGILALATNRLRQKWGAEAALTSQHTLTNDRAAMEAEMAIALNVGIEQYMGIAKTHGWSSAILRQNVLGAATLYFMTHWPDRAAQIAGSNPKTYDAVARALSGRVVEALAIASHRPSTPDQILPAAVGLGAVNSAAATAPIPSDTKDTYVQP